MSGSTFHRYSTKHVAKIYSYAHRHLFTDFILYCWVLLWISGLYGICQVMYYVTLQVIHDSSFSNKLINHFQSLELIYQCSYLNWELSKSMHSSQEQKSTMTFEHDCHHHYTVEWNTYTPPPPVTIFFNSILSVWFAF